MTKEQRQIYNKNYRLKYVERIKERQKRYQKRRYQNNKEQFREKNKKYYLSHREQELKRSKKYHQDHKEEIKANARKQRKLHPEKGRVSWKKWYYAHRVESIEHSKKKNLIYKYNLTSDQRDVLLIKQNYKCLICDRSLLGIKQCTDHSHTTGKIRGILCDYCNKGLGFFFDNPELMDCAAKYLKNQIKEAILTV